MYVLHLFYILSFINLCLKFTFLTHFILIGHNHMLTIMSLFKSESQHLYYNKIKYIVIDKSYRYESAIYFSNLFWMFLKIPWCIAIIWHISTFLLILSLSNSIFFLPPCSWTYLLRIFSNMCNFLIWLNV